MIDAISMLNNFGIYGVSAVCLIVYFATKFAKDKFPKMPGPKIITVILFFILLFTVPTADRYKFKKEVFLTIQQYEGYQIVGITYWGSFTEPLTFFYDFPGSVQIARQDLQLVGAGDNRSHKYFHVITFKYREKKTESLYEVNCYDKKMSVLSIDSNGSYKKVTEVPFDMTAANRLAYCS